MVKRFLSLFMFYVRVLGAKLIFLIITVPVFLVMHPWWCLKGQAQWGEFIDIFSASEWRKAFGNICECYLGCHYFITHPTGIDPNKFPKHVYYDSDEKLLCCIFEDDAVAMNLTFGGTLHTRKSYYRMCEERRARRKNNAKS